MSIGLSAPSGKCKSEIVNKFIFGVSPASYIVKKITNNNFG